VPTPRAGGERRGTTTVVAVACQVNSVTVHQLSDGDTCTDGGIIDALSALAFCARTGATWPGAQARPSKSMWIERRG